MNGDTSFIEFPRNCMTDMCCESLEAESLKFAKTSSLGHHVNHCPYLLVVYHFFLLSLRVKYLEETFLWHVDKDDGFWWRTVFCRLYSELKAFGSHACQLSMISTLISRNRLLDSKGEESEMKLKASSLGPAQKMYSFNDSNALYLLQKLQFN